MRFLKHRHALLVGLIAVMLIAPLFFPSGFYFRIGALILVNSLAVVGLIILIGYAGQISLGHAGFAGIGAYACALAPEHLGLHPGLAGVLGAVLSGVLALLIGRPILRLKGYYLAVATLGFGILVSMLLSNERWLTGGPDGMQVDALGLRRLLRDGGWRVSGGELWYWLSGAALILGVWLAGNIRDSATGRAMRALHGSEVAASTLGVNVAKIKLQAFAISAVYASVAGSLLALQNRLVTPEIAGFLHSVEWVTMAVLGGVGSVFGAVLGASILTLLPQVLTSLHDYEHLILGAIMMFMMIVLPRGLAAFFTDRFQGDKE